MNYNRPMPILRLSILGPVQLYRETENITLKRSKAIALLGYLAVTDVPQTRDHLIDLLWPDSLPDAARKNLRNALWTIRKVLGPEVIQADADHISLVNAVWCDARVFEAGLSQKTGQTTESLQATIDLYRGPLLNDLIITDAPDYELWLSSTRERLGQLYLRGIAALVASYQAVADWQAVMATARQALIHDNLQEPLVRALMEAHTHLGERGEALRQYDKLQVVLRQELGVEPLPETTALREAILSGQLQPAPSSLQVMQQPQKISEQSGSPFVGREEQHTALNRAFQLARNQAQVVVLTGELGIGKTRLWQEWAVGIRPAAIPLETRCLDTTQTLPFAPLIRLFNHPVCLKVLTQSDPPELSAVWLIELTRLLPQIKQYQPDISEPAQLPAEEERQRLFEAFTQLLLAPGSQPSILFIDDLHWADSATLDWLVYLVDRLKDKPLLLVGAYRPDEAPTQLQNLLANWGREGVVQRLSLPQLTLHEADQIVTALAGDQMLAESLYQKSGGNPYFLAELTRAWPEEAPASLVDLVRERVKRLPQVAQQVLQSAAILESDFDFATLRRTAGRDEEETLAALDVLLIHRLLVEQDSGGGYEFSHPLVADLVRKDLSLARRSFLHRRAAEALEATYAGHLENVAGQLTIHYVQAGRTIQAASYAQIAAEQALKLGAPTEAEHFYRQSLELEPTPERRLGLGKALYSLGDLTGARQAYHKAATEFEKNGNLPELVNTRLALADSFRLSQQGDQIIHWAEKALHTAGPNPTPEVEANANHLIGSGMLLQSRSLTEAEAHLNHAAQLAAENELHGLAAQIQFALGNILARSGNLRGALQAFTQTVSLALSAEDYFQVVLGHNNLAYHALLADDLPTAKGQIELGLTLAEKQAFLLPCQYLYSTQGEITLAEGRFDEAEVWFKRSLAEAERYRNRVQVTNSQANLGLVARERGNFDKAIKLLKGARETFADLSEPFLQTQTDLRLAELYLRQGEEAAAEKVLDHAAAPLMENEWTGLQAWAKRMKQSLEQ